MHREHYVKEEEEEDHHFVTIDHGCNAELKEASKWFNLTSEKKGKKISYFIGEQKNPDGTISKHSIDIEEAPHFKSHVVNENPSASPQ